MASPTPGKESENGIYEFTYIRPQSNRSKWESLKLTIWDASEHKFLRRNASSWVLAVLFAICMQGLLSTLHGQGPRWMVDASVIGTNPGMGFRPISNRTEEGSLIWFNSKNETSIKKWTDLLDDYLELYLDSSKLPGEGKNQQICQFDRGPREGNVCYVDDKIWGPCSKEHKYGYNNSSPCFFLELNRIYGWIPEYYNDTSKLPDDMPNDLKDYINHVPETMRNQIWVSCEGENQADRENLPTPFLYYPTRGFASYYYPYLNVEGYLSPLIAVQVQHPTKSILINIECRAWAKNFIYGGGNQQKEGSMHLEILVD